MKKNKLITDSYPSLKGDSLEITKVLNDTRKIAATNCVVLLEGDLGTGKLSVAKLIHELSGVSGNFLIFDVSDLESAEIEYKLFGDDSEDGILEKARGGTLYCKGLESLSMNALSYVFHLLKKSNKKLAKYYNEDTDDLAFRIILSASGKFALEDFESDFFCNVCNSRIIKLPNLNNRRDDLRELTRFLVKDISTKMNKECHSVRKGVFLLLANYPFKSNIIELKVMLENAISKCSESSLRVDDFEEFDNIDYGKNVMNHCSRSFLEMPSLPSMEVIKELAMDEALRRTNGNQTLASKMLGITRKTIFTYLKEKESK